MEHVRLPYLIAAGAIIVLALALWLGGHPVICPCGTVSLWSGDTVNSENSQHLSDWYTPSHILHGILFYAGLWLVARKVSVPWRFTAATVIEAAWELVENSDFVINRYREVTIALDYYGDSVINSVSDMVAMMLGFLLARRAPVWVSVAVVAGFEVLTAWSIRDGLALNVLMLLWPVDAVLEWQAGG
jgi:Protein of unknown function (DUF2585)